MHKRIHKHTQKGRKHKCLCLRPPCMRLRIPLPHQKTLRPSGQLPSQHSCHHFGQGPYGSQGEYMVNTTWSGIRRVSSLIIHLTAIKNYIDILNWIEEVESLDHPSCCHFCCWSSYLTSYHQGVHVSLPWRHPMLWIPFHCLWVYLQRFKGGDHGWGVDLWWWKVVLGEITTTARECQLHYQAVLSLVALRQLETGCPTLATCISNEKFWITYVDDELCHDRCHCHLSCWHWAGITSAVSPKSLPRNFHVCCTSTVLSTCFLWLN